MNIGIIDLDTMFSSLDLGGGSQGQQKAKSFDFIFPHASELIRLKIKVALKQFKWNPFIETEQLHITFKWNYPVKGKKS